MCLFDQTGSQVVTPPLCGSCPARRSSTGLSNIPMYHYQYSVSLKSPPACWSACPWAAACACSPLTCCCTTPALLRRVTICAQCWSSYASPPPPLRWGKRVAAPPPHRRFHLRTSRPASSSPLSTMPLTIFR